MPCKKFRIQLNKRPKLTKWEFMPEPHYTRPKEEKREIPWKESILPNDLAELRRKFPESLPPDDPRCRHPLMHKIEIEEMLARRTQIDIPEFYVGSIMAVTVSDPNAPGRVSRFVGICIMREGAGLRANFTLRNYIEHEGVEIRYDLYNPTIRSIEVLRLEKRLDEHLRYLRDAEPEFSTFPLDMEAEPLPPPGTPVPVNPIKIKMKPWPWTERWYVEFPTLKGIERLENCPDWYYIRSRKEHYKHEKYDLMLEYRMHIPEEDQLKIWEGVKKFEDSQEERRRLEKRKKLLGKVGADKGTQ